MNRLNRVSKRNLNRKAVAPIIATLLMVAIAVVGGVLIYVYTQGFFGKTQTTGTEVDTVTSTGYDMRNIPAATGVVDKDGGHIVGVGDAGAAHTGKNANDAAAIFLKNVGTKDTTINKVVINGKTAQPSGASGSAAAFQAAATGQYLVLANSSPWTLPAGGGSSLPQGTEVTLLVMFDSDSSSGATAGKTVTVVITTTGGTFTIPVVVGQRG